MLKTDVLAALKAIVGERHVLTGADRRAVRRHDQSRTGMRDDSGRYRAVAGADEPG